MKRLYSLSTAFFIVQPWCPELFSALKKHPNSATTERSELVATFEKTSKTTTTDNKNGTQAQGSFAINGYENRQCITPKK